MNASLEDILSFRDKKSARRQELTEQYGLSVVSFSLNLPGPEKRSFLSDFAFEKAVQKAVAVFGPPVFWEILSENGGDSAFFVFDSPAEDLKRRAMALEDSAFGRLFDFDVYDEKGEALHRKTPRRCLLCEKPAAECARSRSHDLSALTEKTRSLLLEFCADTLSGEAVGALLEEAGFTPKPGLIDENNCGAHSDMTMLNLERSAYSLEPFFKNAVLIGFSGTMEALTENGKTAEKAMFAASGGVNTHKGASFLLSLLLAGIGRYLATGTDPFETARSWAKEKNPAENTHGAEVREKYGVGGALFEAVSGFPLAKATYEALDKEDELFALLTAMSLCDDTNLLYRGGPKGLSFVQSEAKKILALPLEKRLSAAKRLDKAMIRKNLSPGGAADLFALALFFRSEEPLFFKKDRSFGDFFTYLAI